MFLYIYVYIYIYKQCEVHFHIIYKEGFWMYIAKWKLRWKKYIGRQRKLSKIKSKSHSLLISMLVNA